jgi:uncharacterized membrane protein
VIISDWHVIFAMSLVTIAIRMSGFFIMSRVPITPFVRAFLESLPGAILISTVVPFCFKAGGIALIGLAVSVITMYFVRRDIIAVIAGLSVVSLLRYFS